ncbi:MAG: DNA-processing protein DprA [Pseudomonadota bacterium]
MDFDLEPGFAEAPLGYAPPPSTAGQDRLDRLRLIRSRRVGPATFRRLMAEHGTASKALEALPEVAAKAGVETYQICPEGVAHAEMKAAKRAGAAMICLGDRHYPAALAEHGQAPPILWALGDLTLLDRPALAMVGTRNASSLGARMTKRLAEDLGGQGFVIVSGLARGIDAIAHDAALPTGTIAVQAGGLDVMYPIENTALAERIGKTGLRLSEQPFGLDPQARHFPLRNRIVAGLAQAVIVVEAAARSGSLITARAALDQGREVLAVPGHPLDSRASGCNLLIRDGAILVRGAEDAVEALGPIAAGPDDRLPKAVRPAPDAGAPEPVPPASATPLAHKNLDAAILALLGPSPASEDQIIRDTGQPAHAVAAVLSALEVAGQIERHPGGMLTRAP